MNPDVEVEKVREIAKKLSHPFVTEDVHFRPMPGAKAYNGFIKVIAFVDARTIVERLNEVMGLDGWQDAYQTLVEGEVRCTLSLKFGGQWIPRTDVGSMSKQEDVGDRAKAAHSDALKRTAVKFGIGLYLHRLKNLEGAYDGKRITQWPTLPTWAIAEECLPAPKELAARVGALLQECCAKAKCDPKDAYARLLNRFGGYDPAKNPNFTSLQKRDVLDIFQELNAWAGALHATPAKPLPQRAAG